MRLNRIFAIVLRHFYLIRGSISRVVPLFVWVFIDVLLWGFITKYLNSLNLSGFNFIPALLGAVVFWEFFVRVMHGVTMAFFEDVWARNFLNIFATPLQISEYLTGLVFSSVATSAVGLVIMLVLASSAFGFSILIYGFAAFPFLLILFLFGIALGIFGCALVLRLGPASEWFVWPIPAIVSPFVGVFYPLSILPSWMQCIAYALPPSYVFESMRSLMNVGQVSYGNLCTGTSLALVYILIACFFFKSTYQRAVRTGLLARYSAETLN